MQVARVADIVGTRRSFRRAMGKKSRNTSKKEPFIEAALARYSKPHFDILHLSLAMASISRMLPALIAYRTAYLKANYSVEFMAAAYKRSATP